MKILVTGANGLVGSRLCASLPKRGHQAWGLGRGPRRAPSVENYLTCDLSDAAQVEAAFTEHKPDAVVHSASMTEVDACEKQPERAFADNVLATKNVARAAASVGAHLVHVSTDYVFDGHSGPYSEEDVPNPRGVYAVTKLMGEQAAAIFAPGCAIARTAVVYGYPPGGRTNFGTWLVETLRKGEQVRLFEDQWVSPSLAQNVADVLGELAARREGGVWNVCGAEVVDRVTLGRSLCEVFELDPGLIVPVRMRDLNLAGPRPSRSGLKVEKVRRHLKEQPLSLAESLARFHEEYSAAGKR